MFVSVDLEENSIKDKLTILQRKINKIGQHNLEKTENLHITINFLGNVSVKDEITIKQKLKKIQMKRFKINLEGLGVFPNKKYIKVVWVGCKGKGIYRLKESISDVLPDKYVSKESFIPHITISRLKNINKKEKNRLITFIDGKKTKKFGSITIKNFKLKRSNFKKNGVVHTEEKIFDLA